MTAASKILGCSTAQVSRYISSLESRIGAKLFHRTTRQLTLTDAGTLFKNDAMLLFKTAKQLDKKSCSLSGDLIGPFVITAPISIAKNILLPLLPKMEQEFESVSFEIIPTNESLPLVQKGVDLAIRAGDVVDESLVAKQIGVSHDVFYASQSYLNKIGEPESIDELNEHKLIVNPYSFNEDGYIKLHNAEEYKKWSPFRATKVELFDLIMELIALDHGIGFAPNYCLLSKQSESEVRQILPSWKGNEWPIYLVHPYQMPMPKKLVEISSFIKSKVGEALQGIKKRHKASFSVNC